VEGHGVLWTIGLLTSLMTAVYMFRLVFLVFHGERADHARQDLSLPAQPALPAPPAPPAPHVHEHLHDAPPAMALALIVLAIGSVAAGWVGPGGRFERFLEPSFVGSLAAVEPVDLVNTVNPSNPVNLMIASSLVAFAGIGIAWWFFVRNRGAARAVSLRFSTLYRLVANKYYVDEIYDAAVVQPIHLISEYGLWKGMDARGIDGAVNGVGDIVGGSSQLLRLVQNGSVRTYAASLFLGVVAILGYYLW
jgi:NADH-quinone oxidoreductase subunit L